MASGDYNERTAIRHSFSQEMAEKDEEPPTEHVPFYQRFPKRYVVACMAFLGFCNIYALRVNLSVAVVAMTRNYTVTTKDGIHQNNVEFHMDSKQRGLLLASFFWGYIITQLPAGWMSSKLGGKHLFGGGIMAAAVLTILTPPVARLSVYFLIVIRVIEGFFEGVTYPCMHAIWSKWAPPLERSKLATFAFSGSYFGTVIALPLSGAIADSLGWSWIFYTFGILGILWFLGWAYLVAESPEEHRTISTEELKYIQDSIGFTQKQARVQQTPWREMFLSLPVWAVIIAHFAENWGFYTLLTELPTFLNQVMHYDLYQAGFLSALPYLVMCIVVMTGGQLADFLRSRQILSTTKTRKLFNCTAFLMQTVFMIVTAYTMTPKAAVACLSLAVGFGGFAWAGFSVNHLDLAPQFASVLMGISNTFATIPGIISPALTGQVATKGTAEEWRVVFYLAAAIYLAGAVFYGLFASGERQPWAEIHSAYEPHTDEEEEE